MASGHMNRANRPNTWLHRPACKREEKPCQLGAVHMEQSRHIEPSSRCPLSGVKRTLLSKPVMSAYDPKRTNTGSKSRSAAGSCCIVGGSTGGGLALP